MRNRAYLISIRQYSSMGSGELITPRAVFHLTRSGKIPKAALAFKAALESFIHEPTPSRSYHHIGETVHTCFIDLDPAPPESPTLARIP